MASRTVLTRDQKYGLMYGDAGSFMAHLSPRARRQVRRAAARRGLTVEGVLQPGPEALRPRSTAGLRRQATKTVDAAYAPVVRQLSDREVQIKALDTKRQLDNKFYRDWLQAQEVKADAVSKVNDQMLLSVVNNAGDQIDARYAQAQQQLNTQNAGTPGTVSDPAQFKGNERLTTEHDLAAGAADIAKGAAVGQIARSQTQRDALHAANIAQVASLESKRMGDTYQALAGVASEKHSAALQRAADVVKETSRLLDGEVTKAQTSQQFQALAEKLGVEQQKLQLASTKERHGYQINKSKLRVSLKQLGLDQKALDHAMTKDQQKQMLESKKFQLDQKKYGAERAKDRYLKQHKLGDYAPGGKKNSGSDANLDKLTRQGRAGILQANAISKQPKYATSYGKYKDHLLAKGVNISVINAGWQYSRGGIETGTARHLRGMGVVVPKEWRRGS